MLHLGPIVFALPFGVAGKDVVHYLIEALIALGFDSTRRYVKEIRDSLRARSEEHDLMYEDLCVRKQWPWRIGRNPALRKVREVAR
ncbi:MAG TPA: hypothetical protein VE998_02000 [Terriglobales bacterium]|nr:hypothetical protein [Terriglobales bacterium]